MWGASWAESSGLVVFGVRGWSARFVSGREHGVAFAGQVLQDSDEAVVSVKEALRCGDGSDPSVVGCPESQISSFACVRSGGRAQLEDEVVVSVAEALRRGIESVSSVVGCSANLRSSFEWVRSIGWVQLKFPSAEQGMLSSSKTVSGNSPGLSLPGLGSRTFRADSMSCVRG